jgi:hypothetical protein
MKNLMTVLAFLFMSLAGYSQYNDTLYFKSGMARPVTIREYDKEFMWYEYRNKKDKLVEAKIAIDGLKSFVIYNEFNELVYDSKTGYRKPEAEE